MLRVQFGLDNLVVSILLSNCRRGCIMISRRNGRQDEKHVAFISDRGERGKSSAIYILSLSGGEAYPITEFKNEKPISSLAWSPGKYIAYLSTDEKTPEQQKKEEDKLDARVYGGEWEYHRLRCVHVGGGILEH